MNKEDFFEESLLRNPENETEISKTPDKIFNIKLPKTTDIEKNLIQNKTTLTILANLDQNRKKNFVKRNFSKITKGGIRSTIFNLFSGTVGAGVLSLPHVRPSLTFRF